MDNVSIKLKVGTVEIPSNPVFGDDVKMKVAREDNQIFNRVKIDGKIKFVGSDFDFIASCSNETELTLSFYLGTNLVGSATFIKADCDLDYADRVCSVKLTTKDRYDKILGGYDNKYNLVKLAPEIWPLTLYRRPVLQFYMLGDTKITNYIGNTAFEEDASAEAENMTAAQVIACAFSQIYTYLTLEVTVQTSMELDNRAAVIATSGTYQCTYTGTEPTRLDRTDGQYSIRKVYDSLLGTDAYKFYDRNGNIIVPYHTDGEGGRTDYVMYAVFSPSLNSGTGTVRAAFDDGEGGHSDAYIGTIKSASRTVFCRMIHNYADTISGLTTVELKNLEQDVAERNYNFLYASTVNGTGVENGIFYSTQVQATPTEYGINDDGDYYVAPAVHDANDVMIPIAWNMWSPMSWWFEGGPWIYEVINQYWKSYILPDAYPLWSCIQRLLAEIDPSITYNPNSTKHLFFRDSYNNTGFPELECDYIPSPRERRCQLFITPITNVKKTFYEQAAQRGDITLKQIFDMLRSVFRVYWWIDDDNELRMEHIEYFKHNHSYVQGLPDADLDIVAMKDMPNGLSWAYGQEEVSFDRSKRPHRYEFEWGDESTEQFQGYAVDIESAEASQNKTEKVRVDNFVSDIDYITIRPNDLSDDLWVLMEAETKASGSSPHKMPWCEISMTPTSPMYSLLNGYLSFMFAEKYYWKYDLGGWRASTKFGNFDVASTAQFAEQKINHPIPLAQVGSVGAVKTGLGVGLVTEQEIAIDTLYAKTKILLNDSRDLYNKVSISESGTHTKTVTITNNFWDTIVFKYALRTTATGNTVTNGIVIAPNSSGAFSYAPSAQAWQTICVERLSSYLSFGDAFKDGKEYTTLAATMSSHSLGAAELTLGGISGEWIYIFLQCDKRTRINLTTSISSSDTYGYVARKPIYVGTSVPSSSDVLAYVGTSGQAQYIAEAGEFVYLGLARYVFATNNDSVEFELEVPEE